MSWLSETYKLFHAMKRPIGYRDVSCRTAMSEKIAQNCICRLLKAGCIRFVSGNARMGRLYEVVPGIPLPDDSRGKHPNTKLGLARVYELRRRASRPTSQVTAARPQASFFGTDNEDLADA